MEKFTLDDFKKIYLNGNSLKKFCLPEFFLDLASGWGQETLR